MLGISNKDAAGVLRSSFVMDTSTEVAASVKAIFRYPETQINGMRTVRGCQTVFLRCESAQTIEPLLSCSKAKTSEKICKLPAKPKLADAETEPNEHRETRPHRQHPILAARVLSHLGDQAMQWGALKKNDPKSRLAVRKKRGGKLCIQRRKRATISCASSMRNLSTAACWDEKTSCERS